MKTANANEILNDGWQNREEEEEKKLYIGDIIVKRDKTSSRN